MQCPECGAANEPAAAICFACRAVLFAMSRGTLVAGRYEVLRPLGRGGMGAVYEAHDRVLDERVALKLLRRELLGSPEFLQRFRLEIKLARRVAHPNVCRIHDYGEESGQPYLSMELLTGETLSDLLKRTGPLSAAEAQTLVAQAARGLAAVHSQGIVHRDLKTANLMCDAAGTVKVMDFGLARESSGQSAGYLLGTPEYMSPEQARGQPASVASDLYALGVVLFELLTGRVPFRGDTPVATLLLHAEGRLPLEAAPEETREVLARALARSPAGRFASAGEMEAALGAAGRAPRSRGPLLLGGLLALAGAAGLALFALRPTPKPAGPAAPVVPVTLEAPASTRAPTPSATVAPPAPSPASSLPARAVARPDAVPSAPPTEPHIDAPHPATTPMVAAPEPDRSPAATAPSPGPSPTVAPAVEPAGLLVLVTPWADVQVDGEAIGQTPLPRLPLAAGSHEVLLTHPDYQPFPRRVTLRPGETLRLVVDLRLDGIRRR